jgi:hypothetical protein
MIKFSISFSQKVELKPVRTTEDIVKLQIEVLCLLRSADKDSWRGHRRYCEAPDPCSLLASLSRQGFLARPQFSEMLLVFSLWF